MLVRRRARESRLALADVHAPRLAARLHHLLLPVVRT